VRTLPAALQTAQRAATRRPYLQVVIDDRNAGTRRLRPARWYTGSEPDGPHAVAVPTDGSLNRLRIEAGITLYRQRVASPTSGSDYTPWTLFRTASRLCAIAQWGANLAAFAVDNATPTEVWKATSADNGATWGAFALAFTHTVTITAIAAAAKPNGEYVVVLNNGNNLSARRWTGAAWNAAVTTSDGELTPTGLAASYGGGATDWRVLVTATIVSGGGSRLAARIFGDGFEQAVNTWSANREIAATVPTSNVAYSAPFGGQPDTHRLACREAYTGTGSYAHINHSYSPATADYAANLWHELTPFDHDNPYGLALAFSPTQTYLTTPSAVYNWPLVVASVDVTADVVSCDHVEQSAPARTTIVLDNADGAYNNPGAGAVAAITRGAQVNISPGYHAGTPPTPTVSAGPAVWIAALTHRFEPRGLAVLVLDCENAHAHLDRWRAPRSLQFAAGAKNVFGQLQALIARAGFEFASTGSSADATALYPATSIAPCQSALAAVRALLSRLPDILFTRAEFFFLNEPLAADTADDALKWQGAPASYHPIGAATYVSRLKDRNHVRAVGGAAADVIGESLDLTEIPLHYAAPAIVADRELTTAAKALDRADALRRAQDIEANADTLQIPTHCGLEVNDVLNVIDDRIGGATLKRRVLRIALRYDRARKPAYSQTLTLGAP